MCSSVEQVILFFTYLYTRYYTDFHFIPIDFDTLHQHQPLEHRSYHIMYTMYSNTFVPVITKPTRITEHSQTLIDHIHIYTDLTTPNYKHKQGILRTDISDHYPVFYLMLKPNSSKNDNENYYVAREINPTKYSIILCCYRGNRLAMCNHGK